MKQIVEEGTWFAVPLRSGGFGVGVVARTSVGGGVVLAYFFKKAWAGPPPIDEIATLEPKDAARVLRVGDLSLINGSWPVLGKVSGWHRDAWAVPMFVRRDDLSRRAWIVKYSDRDTNRVESEAVTAYETGLDRDAVVGAGAAEIILTQLLSSEPLLS